jgi:hypothetical protein
MFCYFFPENYQCAGDFQTGNSETAGCFLTRDNVNLHG